MTSVIFILAENTGSRASQSAAGSANSFAARRRGLRGGGPLFGRLRGELQLAADASSKHALACDSCLSLALIVASGPVGEILAAFLSWPRRAPAASQAAPPEGREASAINIAIRDSPTSGDPGAARSGAVSWYCQDVARSHIARFQNRPGQMIDDQTTPFAQLAPLDVDPAIALGAWPRQSKALRR